MMDLPNPEYQMQKLREIKTLLKPIESGEKIDVEKCLALIAEIRASIPERDRSPKPLFTPEEGRLEFAPIDEIEFDYQIVVEALDAVVAEVHYAQAMSLARAVQAYYAIEDDPAKVAELKTEIAGLQRTYRQLYGKPIPPNPNKK